MPRIDTQQFYNAAIKKYGTSPQGVQWHSHHNQQIRFDIIHSYLPKNTQHYTLVDAGCGFGDFYHYSIQKEIYFQRYIGVDQLASMCHIARSKTAQTILQANIITDPLPHADFYICSGALNILTKFESYQFIQNCYKHSKYGFIFNTLFGKKQSSTYNYLTMKDIKNLANNLHIHNLLIQQGYIKNDLTIFFVKQPTIH